jgi:alpha,alpha-trehalase
LPLLEKEYLFWMKERSADILMPLHGNLTLNIYRTEHWIPRPESFLEDRAIAALPKFDTELKKQLLYQNIASAAESGWDFSGRWIKGNSSQNGLEGIQAVTLVPTDLNVFMLKNEYLLSKFYAEIGEFPEKVDYYRQQAKLREKAIDIVLKSDNDSKWVDFDLKTSKPANRSFYISDISTIWFMDSDKRKISEIISQNQEIIFNYPGGIPASQDFTGQQWDFPNVWAPIQHIFIESLIKADNGTFGEFYLKALNISQRFINSVYCGYEMFGKYTFVKLLKH